MFLFTLHILHMVCTLQKYVDTDPAQAMRVTQAYGDQESTNTMMTTKAIFASFHSVLMDCCWSSVDFLTWEPSFSTSLLGREESEGSGGWWSQRNAFCFLLVFSKMAMGYPLSQMTRVHGQLEARTVNCHTCSYILFCCIMLYNIIFHFFLNRSVQRKVTVQVRCLNKEK